MNKNGWKNCHVCSTVVIVYITTFIPDAPATPTNGATKSGSDRPKVSLCVVTTAYQNQNTRYSYSTVAAVGICS